MTDSAAPPYTEPPLAEFNLALHRWLPVELAEGFPQREQRLVEDRGLARVSLIEAFEHGEHIVDLRCYPHERIALMRLLICIAQAALKGPEDEEEWSQCRAALIAKGFAYVSSQADCFALGGEGHRFLQMHGIGNPKIAETGRLVNVDEARSHLFLGSWNPDRSLTTPMIAVALITYQNCALPGFAGGSYPGEKGKTKTVNQSGKVALAAEAGAIHSFVIASTLIETVRWNLITRQQSRKLSPGVWETECRPVWEFKDHSATLDHFSKQLNPKEYLHRLVPLCRSLWLIDQTKVEMADGFRFGTFADQKDTETKKVMLGTGIREPSATIVEPPHEKSETLKKKASKQAKGKGAMPHLLSADISKGLPKAVWRELHAITVLRKGGVGGPLCLDHLREGKDQSIRLWCGGVVNGGFGKTGKIGDLFESSFVIPRQFVAETEADGHATDILAGLGPNATYRRGVAFAEVVANRVRHAVHSYHKALKDDYRERGRKSKPERARGDALEATATTHYWTRLEPLAEPVLLHRVAMGIADRKEWQDEVWKIAREAYERACPVGTPRQLRAFADGLRKLYEKPSVATDSTKPSTQTT